MSSRKREIRNRFRTATFERDNYSCVPCLRYRNRVRAAVDAHHITNRNMMPNGGYVRSNGISLCEDCHFLAERFDSYGYGPSGFDANSLYALVGSSHAQAIADSRLIR